MPDGASIETKHTSNGLKPVAPMNTAVTEEHIYRRAMKYEMRRFGLRLRILLYRHHCSTSYRCLYCFGGLHRTAAVSRRSAKTVESGAGGLGRSCVPGGVRHLTFADLAALLCLYVSIHKRFIRERLQQRVVEVCRFIFSIRV